MYSFRTKLRLCKGKILVSLVNTKYALIINPDATVHIQTINNFLSTAKDKPNFAIIAPFIQENDQDDSESANELLR